MRAQSQAQDQRNADRSGIDKVALCQVLSAIPAHARWVNSNVAGYWCGSCAAVTERRLSACPADVRGVGSAQHCCAPSHSWRLPLRQRAISWSTASPRWRRRSNRLARSGKRANLFVTPTDLSYAQIDRGARCDVIFALAGAATDEAARVKIIQGATITRALRNGLVLVGTKGAAGPVDGANVADISRLIAGERLAIANPERDPTGARALELLRKIGIAADDNRALAVAESSAGVVNLLATDKARLGIVYSTGATAGFKLLVPLPLLDQPPIEYVVAQARDPQSDTRPFMAFIKSAAAQAAFKSAGLAPIDDAQAAGGGND